MCKILWTKLGLNKNLRLESNSFDGVDPTSIFAMDKVKTLCKYMHMN